MNIKTPQLIAISPQQAYQQLQQDPKACFIDIRSSMEFLFVGHPIGATHIAWLDEPDWEINPNFVAEITAVAKKQDPNHYKDITIIMICRSGIRTQEAGKMLVKAGFRNVFYINEGFEGDRDEQFHRSSLGGWRYHGLPWEQC